MASTRATPSSKRTEAEELAHSLRNIAAAMQGALMVLEEAQYDVQLVKAVHTAMSHQLGLLKDVVEHAERIAQRPTVDPLR